MLRELLNASKRFRHEDKLPPAGYKQQKKTKWVVELGGRNPHLSGPFGPGEFRILSVPDRQRSGQPGPGNLKPFLLMDKAQYSLGKAPQGREKETQVVHDAFLDLLDTASSAIGDPEIVAIRSFASAPTREVLDRVDANDVVAFRVDPSVFPFEKPAVQEFWVEYLSSELASGAIAACCACSVEGPIQRILPRELVLFAQKCQAMSVNTKQQPAFGSFGRSQMENSPICANCANAVVDTLDYMIRTQQHNTAIVRRRSRPGGPLDPFHSQLAVYWLSRPVLLRERGAVIGEEVLRAVMGEEFRFENLQPPEPDIRHVENLLKIPWSPREAGVNLATESFHLAVLSANKGRLVVREWFSVSLSDLRDRLRRFLGAARLIGFYGDEPRASSIATMLEALDSHDPNVSRGLLRTAYLGHAAPSALLSAAVRRLAVLYLKGRQDNSNAERDRVRHIEGLTSAIKMVLCYGKEEVSMEHLNQERKTAPYLCGRLLAALEEAQQRSSNWSLNRTLVSRFYGSASTAPSYVFGNLVRLAAIAHLPKVGKDLNVLVEDVMRDIDDAGGFPATLTASKQAEFGLGFFHQRSDFRRRQKTRLNTDPDDDFSTSDE